MKIKSNPWGRNGRKGKEYVGWFEEEPHGNKGDIYESKNSNPS